MREEKGITIISLVVTIIILIILAGISINLILGEDGLITKAKQAKENIELAQIEEQTHLNELYAGLNSQLGASGDISYDTIAKLAEFKKSIADYIEEAGGIKPEYSADTITFGDSIKGIVKEVTKNATATSEDIIHGKTAYVNGNLITGTALNNYSYTLPTIVLAGQSSSDSIYLPLSGNLLSFSYSCSNQYPAIHCYLIKSDNSQFTLFERTSAYDTVRSNTYTNIDVSQYDYIYFVKNNINSNGGVVTIYNFNISS